MYYLSPSGLSSDHLPDIKKLIRDGSDKAEFDVIEFRASDDGRYWIHDPETMHFYTLTKHRITHRITGKILHR